MSVPADLHIHSTASDGQYTPSEIVALAKAKGLEAIALTDHDTLGGLEEAMAAGRAQGLRVIPGIELSADDCLNLHILGYAFSPEAPARVEMTGSMKKGRNERKYRIAEFLKTRGMDVPLSEVEAAAGGGVIGRPHFAQVMLRHGMVSTRREAFDLYLDTPEFQEMEKGAKPSARKCVEAVKAAGGKVSLAHPYQIVLGKGNLEELVKRLKGDGLDAMECHYPRHTPQQTSAYLALAKKYGLHVTGGSDFHGEQQKPDHLLTAWELELDWLL